MKNTINNIINSENNFCSAGNLKFLSIFQFLICCLAIMIFLPSDSLAQEDFQITAPPPLKFISKDEKQKLETETNIKKYTVLALELMEARLAKAENLSSQKQYVEMYDELGGFHALVDDTLDFLNRHDTGKGKVLNNFKRLEMSLRKFAPRIELIRRDLPLKYESYVRKLIRYVRDARSKAIAPFFDDTVVAQPDKGN